jgi:hypothetical protein
MRCVGCGGGGRVRFGDPQGAGCRGEDGRVVGATGGDYRGWAGCFEGDRTGAYPARVIGGEAELGNWEAGETGLGGVPPR